MAKKGKVSSQEMGLNIGLVVGRFLLNIEDIHYGYWPNGGEATMQNFARAQENHSKLIMDHIPEEVKSILDVGSGSGNLALKLWNKDYTVDCVIPSEFLGKQIQAKLGDSSKIHICGFEQMLPTRNYDLILFSESFQYVKMEESLQKAAEMISPGGYLLICDFFRRNVPGKSPMGGGHCWQKFQDTISTHFRQVTDLDISQETAPTIRLLAQFNSEVLAPGAEMVGAYLKDNYPFLTAILQWKFKKRIQKIGRKYISGEVNEESFKKFKTYHLLLYRHI